LDRGWKQMAAVAPAWLLQRFRIDWKNVDSRWGRWGRKRRQQEARNYHESLQLSAEDIMAAVEYMLSLPLGSGTTDISTVWKNDIFGV